MLSVDKTFFFGVLLITYSGNNDKYFYTITVLTEQCGKLHHSDNQIIHSVVFVFLQVWYAFAC